MPAEKQPLGVKNTQGIYQYCNLQSVETNPNTTTTKKIFSDFF